MRLLAAIASVSEVSLFAEFFSAHLGTCGFAVFSMASISSSQASAAYARRASIGKGMGHVSTAILVLEDFMLCMLFAVWAVPLHELGFLHIVEKNQLNL